MGWFLDGLALSYMLFNGVIGYNRGLVDEFGRLVTLVLSILIMYVISVYCLYNFKAIGNSLFLFTIISYIICLYLGKIQIIGQITYILQYLATLTDGAILTLLYFSPIKEKFQTR